MWDISLEKKKEKNRNFFREKKEKKTN